MRVQIRARGPSSVKLRFAPGLPGPRLEFRVNPASNILEYRYLTPDTAWGPVTGGDLNTVFGASLAQKWATQPTGEVVPGQGYSAKKYAQDAAAAAASLVAATQAEAEAGTNNTKIITPLRLRQAVKVYLDHPPSIKGLGFDVRGDGSTSDADMTRETAAINAAFQASRAVTFPAGAYRTNGQLQTQDDCHIIAPWGFEATQITRGGSQNWAGHTLVLGQSSSYSFHVEGLLFDNPHPTFDGTTPGSIISSRLTQSQAHILVQGGANGLAKNCYFKNAVINIRVLGGTNHVFDQCIFNGFWDSLVVGRQETFANIQIDNDLGGHGYATMHVIKDCYLAGGGGSEPRTYTVGNITFTSHHDIGSLHGLYVGGCEGLKIERGYIGGTNGNGVSLIASGSLLSDVHITDVFFDGVYSGASIFTDNLPGGNSVSTLLISKCSFNGQLQTPRALAIGNSNGVSCDDMVFSDNNLKNHIRSPMLLNGLRNSRIHDNIIRNYNARGAAGGTFDISAGIVAGGSSFENFIGSNTFSGSGAQYGVRFETTAAGHASRQYGSFGLAGGAFVTGGNTPSSQAGTF